MRITTIRYRRLRSHDRGYGHDAIEAEAQLEADETPSHALQELKHWVLERLEEGERVERLARSEEAAERRVNRLKSEVEQLEKQVRAGSAVLNKFDALASLAEQTGLKDALAALRAEGVVDDEIPF